MKIYLKIFIVAFLGFASLFGGVFYAIETLYIQEGASHVATDKPQDNQTNLQKPPRPQVPDDDDDERTELRKIADASSRINVIAFGLNEMLADTMMLISFDPDAPQIDIISIPRDTYNHVEGFDHPAQKKMNAVYGFREVGGVLGMKTILSEFLDIPIDYYVMVDFKAVEVIVDTLGGYEVTITYTDMTYDDIYASPPLHIHFDPGYQVLNGADSVKYLRFRQNNSGTIREGDVQRIPRQQHFVDTMLQKAIGPRLPALINTVLGSNYIKTDMTIETALSYALKAMAIDSEHIHFYMVDGEPKRINGSDYWIHNPDALEKMLFDIYGLTEDEAEKTSD